MIDREDLVLVLTAVIVSALLAGIVFFLSSCVNAPPIPVPATFVSLPINYTPEHDFKVSCYDVGCTDTLLQDIDLEWDWFAVCMWTEYQVFLDPSDFEAWRIVVVPTQFSCYHGEHSWCGGYYVSEFKMIILAHATPTGTLDYYDHELRDVCINMGLCPPNVEEDVANICTQYKAISK